MTRLSIFGLGYVGAVTSACLADRGLDVIGVDVADVKVDAINAGESPIVEEGLAELVSRVVGDGRLRATTDGHRAVLESDLSLICVGTPSNPNGSLDLSAVRRVAESIGAALRDKGSWHTVVVRSTMLPGSTDGVVIPALESGSGLRAGVDFGVCYNPEFLREGSSIRDFHSPPFTIIGGASERANQEVAELYAGIEADVIQTTTATAEMVKYVCNAFHALKVAFANEIGVTAKAHGVDSHEVMEIFARDRKLNISAAYLRPGYAFGGSCLPKDLRALVHAARRSDLEVPVLSAILPSNEEHIARGFALVREAGVRRVGVLGLSFKAGTDDLRESPLVALVERLIGRGYQVCVYDPNVSFANLHGTNRAYIEREIPHIVSLMTDSPEVLLDHSELIVVGNSDPALTEVLEKARPDQVVVDLVRAGSPRSNYRGIAW